MDHVKNDVQNITTEWMPLTVQWLHSSYLHGDNPVGEEDPSEVPVDDEDVEDDVDEVEAVAEDQLDRPPRLVVVHVPEEVPHVAVHVLDHEGRAAFNEVITG